MEVLVQEFQEWVTSEHDCCSLAVGKKDLTTFDQTKNTEKSREGDSLVHQTKTHSLHFT